MKNLKLLAALGCLVMAPALAQDAPPPGGHFSGLDTDGDGALSLAEAEAGAPRLAANFASLDADGDGLVTRAEMQASRERFREDRGQRAEERFSALDTDGDGALSVAEAAAAPGLAKNFERLDADGDGALTHGELKAAGKQFREERREQAEARFKGADANGDGAIDLAEAQTGMPRVAQHFGRIDADGNGLVTRQEMRSKLRQHRQEQRPRQGQRPL